MSGTEALYDHCHDRDVDRADLYGGNPTEDRCDGAEAFLIRSGFFG